MHIPAQPGRRAAALLAASCLLAPLPPAACQSVASMAKEAHPTFEIATIKPTPPNDHNQGFHLDGHRVSIENETVENMMMFAYAIHSRQILDAPAWIHSEAFDIEGVPDIPGEPSLSQYQAMVRSLLEDRFALKFHRARRDLPIYAITVLKSGSKLTPTRAAPGAQPDQTGNGNAQEQFMKFTNNSMDEFALGMQYFLSRPVINQTGLTGRYDFTLRWAPDETPPVDGDAAPAMFTAIQEQLGLRLEATRGPASVLLVDNLQHPSAN